VTQSGLPPEVREFLNNHIRGVGELEVLLLLQRDPGRWWTADQVNHELKTSLEAALKHLEALRDARLVQERNTTRPEFKFEPGDLRIAAIVKQLDTLFRDWIASIADAIYTPRQDNLQQFADAFRLGKKGEPKDG
jgi:predicted ArsR family transcriptional regulator